MSRFDCSYLVSFTILFISETFLVHYKMIHLTCPLVNSPDVTLYWIEKKGQAIVLVQYFLEGLDLAIVLIQYFLEGLDLHRS